jgi:hypothetical protein
MTAPINQRSIVRHIGKAANKRQKAEAAPIQAELGCCALWERDERAPTRVMERL